MLASALKTRINVSLWNRNNNKKITTALHLQFKSIHYFFLSLLPLLLASSEVFYYLHLDNLLGFVHGNKHARKGEMEIIVRVAG